MSVRNESFASRLLLLVLVVSAMGSAAAAQYERRALERAREVRMLADDREAVRLVFHEFVLDESDEVMDDFSFAGTKVAVSYASGKCNEDIEEIWDAPQGRVTKIEIEFDGDVEATVFQAELSRLNKEKAYADSDGIYIHHDKKLGLAFSVDEETVEKITVFPAPVGRQTTIRRTPARRAASTASMASRW